MSLTLLIASRLWGSLFLCCKDEGPMVKRELTAGLRPEYKLGGRAPGCTPISTWGIPCLVNGSLSTK